ncbi:MAG: hypothetical protein K2M19_01415 [Muribaculaceae bacterium]|nr:hypothetical protein [Muribaculaceae bacterium]
MPTDAGATHTFLAMAEYLTLAGRDFSGMGDAQVSKKIITFVTFFTLGDIP